MSYPPNRKFAEYPKTLSPFKASCFSQIPIKELVLDVNEVIIVLVQSVNKQNLRHLKRSPLDTAPFESISHQEAKQILSQINYLSHRLISTQIKHDEILNHIEKLKTHISEKNNQIDQIRKNLKNAERETNFHAKENQNYKTKIKKIMSQIASLTKKNQAHISNQKRLLETIRSYQLEQERNFREIESRQEVYPNSNQSSPFWDNQKENLEKMLKQSLSNSQQMKPKMKYMPQNQNNFANSQPLSNATTLHHQSSLPSLHKQQSSYRADQNQKEEQFCESFKLLLEDYKSGQLSIFEKLNRQYKELLLYIKQSQQQQIKLVKSDQMNEFLDLIGVPLCMKQVFHQKLDRSIRLEESNIFKAYQTSHQVFFQLFKRLLAYGSKMARNQLPILNELVKNYNDLDAYQKTKSRLVQAIMQNNNYGGRKDVNQQLQEQTRQHISVDRYSQLIQLYTNQTNQIDEFDAYAEKLEKNMKQFDKMCSLSDY